MIQISYTDMLLAISIIWILVRGIFGIKNKKTDWKRELQLMLVYISIIVIARFVFFPFEKINGEIQSLIFDREKMFPLNVNFAPMVHLFDYVIAGEATLNLIGNISMFIPVGIIWPIVFKELNTSGKVLAAGVSFSLLIEIMQLPFYDRVSDVDDLILNSLGYVIGYLVYVGIKKIKAGDKNDSCN